MHICGCCQRCWGHVKRGPLNWSHISHSRVHPKWNSSLQLHWLGLLTQKLLCTALIMYIITWEKNICVKVTRSVRSGGHKRTWMATLDHMSMVLIFLRPQISVDFLNYLWSFIYNSYFICLFFLGRKVNKKCLVKTNLWKCTNVVTAQMW